MFSHKKGVKKLLLVGFYSLSITSDVPEEVPQVSAQTQSPCHQLIQELQHQTLGFGSQLDDEDGSLQVQLVCLLNSELFVRLLPAKVQCWNDVPQESQEPEQVGCWMLPSLGSHGTA